MIIKGNRHGNGAKLAAYLLDGGKHGERVAEPELYGFAAEDISGALRDVQNLGDGLGIENPLFHIQIRLPAGEQLTREQWDITTARVLQTAGLEGQPYARVFHTDEKTGEIHCHLGVSLIDEQTHKAKAVPFYKLRFKALARKLEDEFDLTRVRNHRDSAIKYGATKNEERQAQRLGFSKDAVRNSIRNCWDATDCGRGLDDALAEAGLILAQGDRRDFLVIDPKGGVHALGKRILGASAEEVRERLSDLDRENMPTLAQARQFMLDMPRDQVDRLTRELAEVQKQIEAELEYARRDPVREEIEWEEKLAQAAIEKEKIERQFVEPERATRPCAGEKEKPTFARARILDAERHARLDARTEGAALPDADAVREELEQRGIAFALVSKDEAYRSHREAAFANEIGRKGAEFNEGEIVLVTVKPLEHLRAGEWNAAPRVHALDQDTPQTYLAYLSIDKSKLKSIEATKEALDADAEKRAAYWRDIRLERAAAGQSSGVWAIGGNVATGMGTAATIAAKIMNTAPRAVTAALDISVEASGMVFSLLSAFDAPKSPRQQARDNYEGEKATAERNAEADARIEFSQFDATRMQARRNQQQEQAARDREREQLQDQERSRQR